MQFVKTFLLNQSRFILERWGASGKDWQRVFFLPQWIWVKCLQSHTCCQSSIHPHFLCFSLSNIGLHPGLKVTTRLHQRDLPVYFWVHSRFEGLKISTGLVKSISLQRTWPAVCACTRQYIKSWVSCTCTGYTAAPAELIFTHWLKDVGKLFCQRARISGSWPSREC